VLLSQFQQKGQGMKVNPEGSDKSAHRVARGGSWDNDAMDCRVANRGSDDATNTSYNLGFRLALSVPARKSRDERKS